MSTHRFLSLSLSLHDADSQRGLFRLYSEEQVASGRCKYDVYCTLAISNDSKIRIVFDGGAGTRILSSMLNKKSRNPT